MDIARDIITYFALVTAMLTECLEEAWKLFTVKSQEANYEEYIVFKSYLYWQSTGMILPCKTTVVYHVLRILEVDLNALTIIICKLLFYKIQQR